MPRRLAGLAAFNLAGLLVAAGLAALGTWQVQRRAWKLDLIARVEARVHAAPVPAPGPAAWPGVSDADDSYRHVRVAGRFLHDEATLVQALTELGSGSWALVPLRTSEGFTVLVNRGFVPSEKRDPAYWRAPEGPVAVTGLMRMSEPGGAFLRANDPATDRWTSRDVAMIAKARGLETGLAIGPGEVAPYFIDAGAEGDGRRLPVGGLTVIAFRNHHLIYAITWYVLALMAAGALVYVDLDFRSKASSGKS